MAVSSKDLETLWQRYKVEAVPAGISVNQFFESNGIPYHVFEKWYKKKYQAPNVVDCVVQGVSEANKAYASSQKQETTTVPPVAAQPNDAVVVKYINLGLAQTSYACL